MNVMNIKTELLTALAKFQQEVPVIHEGAKNDFGKYTYADLKTILRTINPLMAKYELGYTQFVDGDELVTMVYHCPTAQYIESRMRMITGIQLKGMNEFQVYGSMLTYFRRYGISQILGLITDVDNDASGEQVNVRQSQKKPLTDQQFDEALVAIQAGQYSKDKIIKNYKLTESQILALNEI